jgi:hypothetical protein
MISEEPLLVCFKNFYRNKMVNLSATSVKHFLPNARIFCFTLYKESMNEYADQEPLHDYITEITGPTKWVSKNTIYDHVDVTKTSGFDNNDNAAYFAEGYNIIQEHFADYPGKLLMLAEDHFFTTGETLKELLDNEWDIAYGDADSEQAGFLKGNGSIIGIRPSRIPHLFPMPEYTSCTIEWVIGNYLLRQVEPEQLHSLSTRTWWDVPNYHGDGIYTNSSQHMAQMMKEAGII